MKCEKCGEELSQEMIDVNMCWNCGNIIDKSLLDDDIVNDIKEGQEEYNRFLLHSASEINDEILSELGCSDMIFSTSHQIDGYEIEKYIGIVSGDTVIGTGFLSTIASNISDLFGEESEAYATKMQKAKNSALIKLLEDALKHNANAVIGISFEYVSLSRDLIGVSVNGTAVTIKSLKKM